MYYVKVNWFNNFTQEDSVSHMLIPAENWNDAMQKVSGQFDFINSIEMKEIDFKKCDVVFLPEDVVEAVIEENMS